jgi:hypothetical protein
MCDYSGKLVAWMDRELPDNEAADVDRHVLACAECGRRIDAYEQVSASFVAYCDAAVGQKTPMPFKRRHWIPVLSAVAVAAVLSLVFVRVSVKQIPIRSRAAEAAAAVVRETAPRPVKTVHRRRPVPRTKMANAGWTLAGPAVQIVIPAEAMFPPGAVPEGINFIAELDIADDGSAQGLRLQP